MTIGPAPMIRIVEISVRFGIASRLKRRQPHTKKGLACRASLYRLRVVTRARPCLDQIPQPGKGHKRPSTSGFPFVFKRKRRLETRPGFEPGLGALHGSRVDTSATGPRALLPSCGEESLA